MCGLWLVRLDTDYGFNSSQTPNSRKHRAGDRLDRTQILPSSSARSKSKRPGQPKPKSLYPALILGSAMVARGEIGFLVSAITQSNGIFDSSDPNSGLAGAGQDLFLIVTWAIMLCAVTGPLVVGLIVRRVRRLQSQFEGSAERSGGADSLGTWGVEPGAESNL